MGYNYINIHQILETTQVSNICKKIECCVCELTYHVINLPRH